jgi:large subunit ribosomal protein L4
MKLKVANGAPELDVSDENFGREYNEALVFQVVNAYRAAGRAGTKAQKSRAEVRGGGRKPHAQKGTGSARAGSIRSPIWVGGGRAFAARPRDFTQKVNRKMYRGALRSMLSELVRQDRLVVIPEFAVEAPKTKLLAGKLKAMGLDSALVITDAMDENLLLASRNLKNVLVVEPRYADPLSLIHYKRVIVTKGAMAKIEEMWG